MTGPLPLILLPVALALAACASIPPCNAWIALAGSADLVLDCPAQHPPTAKGG